MNPLISGIWFFAHVYHKTALRSEAEYPGFIEEVIGDLSAIS